MSENLLTVSSSPHVHSELTTRKIMLYVLIALLPACMVSVYVYGLKALLIILVGTASAVIAELICQKIMKKEVTIADLSAAVTGLLLALNMPVNAPLWLPMIGSFIAIVLIKQLYGGLGNNFINPALGARVILMISWPALMSGAAYIPASDVVTAATPLAAGQAAPSVLNMFLGFPGVYGCLGEISALALLIGGAFLIIKKVITPVIPLTYIGTVAAFSLLAGKGLDGTAFQLCAGGLMLGAIFMATDYVTSPSTRKGQLVFAIGCGLLTCIIRFYGAYDEGVSFAILLMNVATPLIDKYMRINKYGAVKKK